MHPALFQVVFVIRVVIVEIIKLKMLLNYYRDLLYHAMSFVSLSIMLLCIVYILHSIIDSQYFKNLIHTKHLKV